MRLSKDKATLIYNDFLTLSEIPKETYDYRLGISERVRKSFYHEGGLVFA